MSDNKSVFSDDWRDCLKAHYRDVVQRNDQHTEQTLTGVLHDVGFSDDDLRQLKLEATMRTEDLQGDFVPQLDLGAEPTVHAGVDVPPADDPEPKAEAAASELTEEPDTDLDANDDPPDDDRPQQMSLF